MLTSHSGSGSSLILGFSLASLSPACLGESSLDHGLSAFLYALVWSVLVVF